MQKWIITVLLAGMVGWAIYSAAAKNEEQAGDQVQKPLEQAAESAETAIKETEKSDGADQKKEKAPKGNPNEIGLDIGNIAPDFELETMDGEKVKLSDYRGKPVLLNFWATWCPPCQAEMPDMEKFYKKTNMPIVSVNLTTSEATEGNVKAFIDKYDLTFPVLLDKEVKASGPYKINPIPTTYFLDKTGRIYYKMVGPMNYDFMMTKYEELK